MASSSRRFRQYAGLAIILLVYIGGIIGWSWAVSTTEAGPAAPDSTTAATPAAVEERARPQRLGAAQGTAAPGDRAAIPGPDGAAGARPPATTDDDPFLSHRQRVS